MSAKIIPFRSVASEAPGVHANHGHALSEAEWGGILHKEIAAGCVLCGFRSSPPLSCRPGWEHEAFLRAPKKGGHSRFVRVFLDAAHTRVLGELTLPEIREDLCYIFTEGTLLPAFTAKKVQRAAGGAR